jgi:hypothetical protein
LGSFALDSLISYPLHLEPGEAPDFALSMGSKTVGIEITEATHPDYGWACERAERDPDAILELDAFQPGKRVPRVRGAKPPMGRMDRPLMGEGFRGNAMEKNWSQFVHEAIQSKTTSLGKTGFSRHQQDWLLVFDYTPTCLVQVPKTLSMLETALTDYFRRPDCFHEVLVDAKKAFVHLSAAGSRIVPLNDLWPRVS